MSEVPVYSIANAINLGPDRGVSRPLVEGGEREREMIFIELTTSDRKLKASREGSK